MEHAIGKYGTFFCDMREEKDKAGDMVLEAGGSDPAEWTEVI